MNPELGCLDGRSKLHFVKPAKAATLERTFTLGIVFFIMLAAPLSNNSLRNKDPWLHLLY